VGGELVQAIGGGICYASTALFRAVYQAGLQIVEHHPHSRPLERHGNGLGFDSAVYSPGLDLRWRNDTPHPIEVATSVDASSGKVTIAVWGVSDGRTATVRGPSIKNRRSVPDTWQFDAGMAEGASRKTVDKLEGMDVVFSRVVRAADGAVLHDDGFRARYTPRGATYRFGNGVTPPEGAVVE
ncbi:MAG TPA: VanW family protein, partial [Roseiflexaceae bacterium]|nr:VanW family protein [Roseiflexaceae bacterium]